MIWYSVDTCYLCWLPVIYVEYYGYIYYKPSIHRLVCCWCWHLYDRLSRRYLCIVRLQHSIYWHLRLFTNLAPTSWLIESQVAECIKAKTFQRWTTQKWNLRQYNLAIYTKWTINISIIMICGLCNVVEWIQTMFLTLFQIYGNNGHALGYCNL